ncbi:MAG: NigD-like protein [Paludibacter sp.]|nr:NigD-like protein [Paludibacter sp.]
MKTKQIIYLIAITAIFASCLPKNEPVEASYISPIGTVDNPTLSSLFTFNGDDGFRYIVTETKYPDFKPKTGTRMAILFNELSRNNDTKVLEIRLISGSLFETRNVLPLTKAVADTVGNDPVYDVQMYIGSHFLNINYKFNASGNIIHTFDMVRDSLIAYNSQDTIKLEFRHNSHNDMPVYPYANTMCFNISDLQNFSVNPDSVPLVVSVKDVYGTPKKYILMYKF